MTVYDALTSAIGAAIPAWTKSLVASAGRELDLTVTTTQAGNPVVNVDGLKSFVIAVQPVSADFVSTLVVNTLPNGLVTGMHDTVIQKFDPESIPDPLPILGAAAFGFSRKLHSRIKMTVWARLPLVCTDPTSVGFWG